MKNIKLYIRESIFDIDDESIVDKSQFMPRTTKELKNIITKIIVGRNTEFSNLYDKKTNTIDLNTINTKYITDLSNLTQSNFNFDVSEWNVSNVKTIEKMFNHNTKFNCDLSNWDVRNVENMDCAFIGCENFEGKGLENWKPTSLKTSEWTFAGCNEIKLPSWYKETTYHPTSNAELRKIVKYFTDKYIQRNGGVLFLNCIDVSNVKDFSNIFKNNTAGRIVIDKWDVSNATTMECMFQNCTNIYSMNIKRWYVRNVTNMNNMFYGCTYLRNINLLHWKPIHLTSMYKMFYECVLLDETGLYEWDIKPHQIVNAEQVFAGCKHHNENIEWLTETWLNN